MSLSDYLVTDDLTVLLGLVAATVFLLHNLYKPQPLVHPILLGRQSDVSRVRHPGESAVYRNYGTGLMGRLPTKPSKEINVLADLVKTETDAPRTLWSTKITNPELADRVAAFGTGLLRLAKLVPRESNVLLLLNDSIEFLIADLSLAAHSIPSFTLSSPSLLSSVLESHSPSAIITTVEFLPHVLELIYDSAEHGHHTVIVTGGSDVEGTTRAKSVNILGFMDIEMEGAKGDKIFTLAPSPSDVFTVSFFETESGQRQAAQLTHENLTAGVAAARALLPLSSAFSPLDTIISSHSLSTAYGRAIAYTAVFEGSNFATLDSTRNYLIDESAVNHDIADVLSVKKFPIPSPTIYFIKPAHLHALASAILKQAHKSLLLHPFAWRHKLAGMRDGFITKDSLWDRLLFDGARAKIVGEGAGTIRGVIIGGGASMDRSYLEPARIAFSVPVINTHSHPLVSGPIFASHPYDLQDFPATTDSLAHLACVGPPSINVEAKLVGVDDDVVEGGSDPIGVLLIRGPAIGKELRNVHEDVVDEEGWVRTGERAKVYPNGSFKVLAR